MAWQWLVGNCYARKRRGSQNNWVGGWPEAALRCARRHRELRAGQEGLCRGADRTGAGKRRLFGQNCGKCENWGLLPRGVDSARALPAWWPHGTLRGAGGAMARARDGCAAAGPRTERAPSSAGPAGPSRRYRAPARGCKAAAAGGAGGAGAAPRSCAPCRAPLCACGARRGCARGPSRRCCRCCWSGSRAPRGGRSCVRGEGLGGGGESGGWVGGGRRVRRVPQRHGPTWARRREAGAAAVARKLGSPRRQRAGQATVAGGGPLAAKGRGGGHALVLSVA